MLAFESHLCDSGGGELSPRDLRSHNSPSFPGTGGVFSCLVGDAMARKRRRLVPAGAVEIFEIRIVLWFDEDGARRVTTIVSTPEDTELETLDRVELFGALDAGEQQLRADYADDE